MILKKPLWIFIHKQQISFYVINIDKHIYILLIINHDIVLIFNYFLDIRRIKIDKYILII